MVFMVSAAACYTTPSIYVRKHCQTRAPCAWHTCHARYLTVLNSGSLGKAPVAGYSFMPSNLVKSTQPSKLVLVQAAQDQPVDTGFAQVRPKPQAWMVVCAVSAVAMGLCNFHRNTFSALLPELVSHYNMAPSEVGMLSSAMLVGYLTGQVPYGILADKLGGERVLLVCLALWALSTVFIGVVPSLTQVESMVALVAGRAAFGLFSACVMPCVSSLTARWVPSKSQASAISSIYLFFNLGGVMGLSILPFLSDKLGWSQSFVLSGLGGLAWALMGFLCLPRTPPPKVYRPSKHTQPDVEVRQQQPSVPNSSASGPRKAAFSTSSTSSSNSSSSSKREGDGTTAAPSSTSGVSHASASQQAASQPWYQKNAVQVGVLCWAHAVIGWGFFIFQSWIPLYLQSLGSQSATGTGLLAGLPWLAAGLGGTVAGQVSERLMRAGVPRLKVRHYMHVISTLGCAACALPLALSTSITPEAATAWLVAFNLCYAGTFGGFHPYVQEVGGSFAGRLIALTNSCSIGLGILGNMVTGWLLETTGTYTSVFWVTGFLYLTSMFAFLTTLKGQPVQLSGI